MCVTIYDEASVHHLVLDIDIAQQPIEAIRFLDVLHQTNLDPLDQCGRRRRRLFAEAADRPPRIDRFRGIDPDQPNPLIPTQWRVSGTGAAQSEQ